MCTLRYRSRACALGDSLCFFSFFFAFSFVISFFFCPRKRTVDGHALAFYGLRYGAALSNFFCQGIRKLIDSHSLTTKLARELFFLGRTVRKELFGGDNVVRRTVISGPGRLQLGLRGTQAHWGIYSGALYAYFP